MYFTVLLLTAFFSSAIISLNIPPEAEKMSLNSRIEETISSEKRNIKKDQFDVKTIPDLYFECYIAEINLQTQIPLFYDTTVRYYINLYFTERKDQINTIRKKAEDYFPLFIRHLDKYNLPRELKFLPVLESGLSAMAVSVSGAVGLWQFKKETGAYYGLHIDNLLDERVDPEASTIAACKYLSELYRSFGNWHLTLMAYQAGPGTINRAIKSAGGKTGYNDLFPYLPAQTQKYLPAFISMLYIFNFYGNHS